jgi:hypothetical protein
MDYPVIMFLPPSLCRRKTAPVAGGGPKKGVPSWKL